MHDHQDERGKKKKKVPLWLKISGLGCGAIILIVIILVGGSVLFVRDALQDFEVADRAFDTLAEQHGPISDFHPDPDGRIRPDRLELFLAVRDASEEAREELENSLTVLSADEDDPGGSFQKMAAIASFAHKSASLLTKRNQALLNGGMGLGEYYYLYTLAFYSWLGKSPDDGPKFKLVGDNGYVLEDIQNLDEEVVREQRMELTRTSLNRMLLPILRNQLSDLTEDEVGTDLHAWSEMLSEEIAALESDSHRLPWQDGLPEVIESSLRPYNGPLQESYGPMCNALEVGVARRGSRLSDLQ